jgi:hypothetical protein
MPAPFAGSGTCLSVERSRVRFLSEKAEVLKKNPMFLLREPSRSCASSLA